VVRWNDHFELFRRPVRTALPRILVNVGRNVEDSFYTRDALIVAAHQDDETFGCGATIARKSASGARVWIVVATDGSRSPWQVDDVPALVEQRRSELFRATSRLGVPEANVWVLGLPDTKLATAQDDLAERVAQLVLEHRPSQVFTHSRWDPHPDHRSCWQAVMQSMAMVRGELPDLHNAVFEFPIWDWSMGPWWYRGGRSLTDAIHLVADPVASMARGRPWLSSTQQFLSVKRDALTEYQSQIAPWFGQPPALTAEFVEGLCGPYEVFLPAKFLGRSRGGWRLR
jgi:LmbE family N-acetylglucosaminyl deacetylase